MERRLQFQTERGAYGLVFTDQGGSVEFIKGEVENKTGTIITPFKLLANPSLPRALWYVLTGRFKAYCHIEGCPYSGNQVSLLKKCDVCNYSFSVARKMLRLLRRVKGKSSLL